MWKKTAYLVIAGVVNYDLLSVMTQYHAHRNKDAASQKTNPLVLEVQSRLLQGMATRVVLPMRKLTSYAAKPISRLNPVLQIDGVDYIVIAQQISVMPAQSIGASAADFSSQQHVIVAAVDCVLSGL
jgi:toxin CcdB